MTCARSLVRAVIAECYRSRAKRMLTRVDLLLVRSLYLKDQAARIESGSPVLIRLSFHRLTTCLCGLLLATLLVWLVHDAWQ